jgi:activating signal cointegrator 1
VDPILLQHGGRILSVRQPWCSLLLSGEKVLENRTWATPYRGRLWLHASKTAPHEPVWRCVREDWLTGPGVLGKYPSPMETPRGVILGSVDLVGCYHINRDIPYHLMDRWDAEGLFCWHMVNPVLLAEPIPAYGMPGVWRW